MIKIIKLYETFIDNLPKLTYVLDQLTTRIRYWFSNEDSAFSQVNFLDLQGSTTTNAPTQSRWFQFNDDSSVYKVVLTMNVDDLEKCNLVIYKYDSDNQFDQFPPKIMENGIDVNDIKEDFIIQKLAKFDEKDKNPDKNRIDTAKEPEDAEATGSTQAPPQAGAPPQMGGAPPMQGAPQSPPQAGAPPQMGGAPPMQGAPPQAFPTQ